MSEPTTSAEPPFDFAQIRRSAYDLLAQLSMDFENGKPDENVRYRAPVRVLEQLLTLVGGATPPHLIGNGKLSSNPFGDGVTFHRPKEPITVGFFQLGEDGKTSILEEPAPPSDVRVRASRLSSDRDAFALQRLWEVASDLQSYFGLELLIRVLATNEPRRQSPNSRERGEPLPSQIIPRLQEAIRLLDEQRTVSARPAFETWFTILSELDKEYPSFRPTIEFDPGPRINEKWVGVVTGYSGTTPIMREKPETRPFRPMRRLASGLVPLLESVGISLPDDAGSNAHGRLLFWAWHIHKGTPPTLPSWEVELEKVLPESGAFAIIKSAIIKSVNPDGSAKRSSPNAGVTPNLPISLPKGVTLLDAAFVLQGLNKDDQSDKERREAAVEMKQKWRKCRPLKRELPCPIGFDPLDSQAHLFDVVAVSDCLAKRHSYLVTQLGGEKEFVSRLRKFEREPLPVRSANSLTVRRTDRTARASTKTKNSSVANRRDKR